MGRLRQRPGAEDLPHRCPTCRAEEQRERTAVAELAAERREQKALEFLHSRFKAQGGGKQEAVTPNALFDPLTGKPRDDGR